MTSSRQDMSDLEPSPRSTKRRKLVNSGSRSNSKPASAISVPSKTSRPGRRLSQRILESNKVRAVQEQGQGVAAALNYPAQHFTDSSTAGGIAGGSNATHMATQCGVSVFDEKERLLEAEINPMENSVLTRDIKSKRWTEKQSLNKGMSTFINTTDGNDSPMLAKTNTTKARRGSLRGSLRGSNQYLETTLEEMPADITTDNDQEATLKVSSDGHETTEPVVITTPTRNANDTYDTRFPISTQDGMDDASEAEQMIVNAEYAPPKTRSSGREKRRPRRFLGDLAEDAKTKLSCSAVVLSSPLGRTKKSTNETIGSIGDAENPPNQISPRSGHHSAENLQYSKRKRKLPMNAHPVRAKAFEQNGDFDALSERRPETDNEAMQDAANLPLIPDVEEGPQLTRVKSVVLSRLTSKSLPDLDNSATEYKKIYALLSATTTAGEGNSMLVLGSRGCGKSTLIEAALKDLRREHADDFHVVRLSGFSQTDDKLALREIWRQLGKEMQVNEDETKQVSSYADTMASLLHLLSHPEELSFSASQEGVVMTPKSVVFILDEFDLFATHPRQTLLYNLFDIAQAKKAPIAVIGCSTRVDVADTLEKRVKSRFSHRWVHLTQPKSLREFEDVVERALCVDAQHSDWRAKSEKKWVNEWNQYIKMTFVPDPAIQFLIRQEFHMTKSVPSVLSALYIPVASITSFKLPPSTTSSAANPLASLRPADSILHLLSGLPHLHLSLLICAARLDAIHNAALVNLNLVYSHYVELASRSRMQSSASGALVQGSGSKIWAKEVAKAAWEQLGDWDLILPASSSSSSTGRTTATIAPAASKAVEDGLVETRMWRVDVTLEEIGSGLLLGSETGLADMLGKWCREI